MLKPARKALRRLFASHDEQGSLIVALSVIMVVFLLGSVLAAKVIGNQFLILTRQSTASAVSAADAGLSDALFRLDQGPSTSQFCVNKVGGSTDPACVAGSIPGASGVSYNATTVPANTPPSQATEWVIQSKATVRGQSTAVRETVERTALFPFALFGNTSLNFNGGTAGFSNYTPGQTSTVAPSNSNPVYIGSNGTISCNGGLAPGVIAQYYSRGGGSNCGTGIPQLYNVPTPQPPQSGYQSCPNGGSIGTNNGVATIGNGSSETFVCTDQTLTISGNLSVSGNVTIYVNFDSTTNTAFANNGTPALFISGGAMVNMPTDGTLPNAQQLTIFSNSQSTVGNYNGNGGYTIGAVLDFPNASLTGDGCKSTYYGAVIINIYTCNGGGQGNHLFFSYDDALSSEYGQWTPTAYLQIPPGTVTIP